jgi:hypothetical protein
LARLYPKIRARGKQRLYSAAIRLAKKAVITDAQKQGVTQSDSKQGRQIHDPKRRMAGGDNVPRMRDGSLGGNAAACRRTERRFPIASVRPGHRAAHLLAGLQGMVLLPFHPLCGLRLVP